jgi:FMN phosphatase YigB (HAD superfamily)
MLNSSFGINSEIMKKIIFFDGDGTLWYPRRTRYNEKPWWIYKSREVQRDPRKHLILTPGVSQTLKILSGRGIVLAVLSTRPSLQTTNHQIGPEAYVRRLKGFARYFHIDRYIDEFRACDPVKGDSDRKDVQILSVLREKGIPKSKALMVGDSYDHDYLPARKAGIDCILINSFSHTKNDRRYRRLRRKIPDLSGIFRYLD